MQKKKKEKKQQPDDLYHKRHVEYWTILASMGVILPYNIEKY